MKKTDRRIEKTIAAVEHAYFELLSERKDDRMTVTEIARRANIDRKTFYLHYANPDDVLKKYSKRLASKIMQALEENGFFDNVLDVSLFFRTVLAVYEMEGQKNIALSNLAITNLVWKTAESNFTEMITAIATRFFDESDLRMMISIKFYTAGIMSIFASYLRHEIEITDSELIDILSELTTSGFSKRLIEN